MDLSEKMRRAREQRVQAGGFGFTIRRPTPLDMIEMQGGEVAARQLMRFVVGWDGITEAALFPGGTDEPVPFDAGTCAEFLADRPDILGTLIEAVLGAYRDYSATLDQTKKK